MINNWQPVACDRPNITLYERQSPRGQAEIERHEDGSASASSKHGPLGLGMSIEADYFSPAPSDEQILDRMDQSAYPPIYGEWKEVEPKGPKLPSVKTYEGRETGGLIKSKVTVTIDRDKDRVDFVGKVGHFGMEMEGTFFAPTPTDQEILTRLSRNPKLD